jgi:uncharacterized repeat protein (TIGR01451 family)
VTSYSRNSERAHISSFSLVIRLVTALLVALLSVPFGGAVALADDTVVDGTTQTDPAATDPAATDPAATDPAATDPAPTDPATTDPAPTDPAATDPSVSTDPSPSAPSKSGTQSLVSPQNNVAVDQSLVPGVCDSNNLAGDMSLFQQNTLEDASGSWINGALNQQNSVYAEGHFVPQRAVFTLPSGENEFTFTYDMTKSGLYAYDYVSHLALEGAPAGSTVSWDAPAGTPPVPLPSYDNNDGTATVLVHVTIEMAAAGSVTLRWDGHIASELDYGPNMGAGTISGAPYHFSSEQLNCASAGQHDNQLMADAVLAGTLTVVKDAQPNSSTDFHFSILPGGAASTFDLDDDADATLPNTVTFRVAPGNYTMQELNIPAGWNLTGLNCVSTGGNTSSSDTGTATGSATVVDDGNTTCTFVNSRAASLVVDKVWKVNGVDYPNGQQPASLQLSAQLTINGTNQGWGVARTDFLAGDSATLDESTTIGNTLCSLDGSAVTLANGSPISVALPYNTGPLAGGANSYTITNTVTCVAQVTLVKSVLNGPTAASAWTLSANDGGSGADLSGSTGVSGPIKADTAYTLAENNADPRYDQIGPWTCTNGVTVTNSTINVAKGASTTCTVVNATAKLIIIKHVQNDSGGTAVASDFTLSFSPGGGNADTSDPGAEAPGTSYWVNPGTEYTVTESGPANYTKVSTVCAGQNTNKVTPAANTTVTCTVTNDDNPGTLTLVKVLDNGTTGSTYTLHDFTLTANGPTPVSGLADSQSIVSQTVNAGSYALSESGPLAGYDASQWTCVGGTQNGSNVTVPLGGNVTCQITNTAVAPKLTLIKHVVNPDGSGGTAVETDWVLTADGPVDISGPGGVGATNVQVGTYTLSESTGPDGYSASGWTCSGGSQTGNQITLALRDVAVCEITNTAQQGSLTLIKHVNHGTTGDTTPATAWTLLADGTSTDLSGAGGASGNVPAGTYALSESGPTAGWTASGWSCSAGQSGSNVTVALGQHITCEITNTAIKPTLTLIKHVDNGDTGAGKVPTDWTLTATSGQNVVSGPGGASSTTPIGTYALTENGPSGFTPSAWTCDGGQNGANVTLALGDNITCEITNTANPATLTLVKVVDHNGTGDLTDKTAWVLEAQGPQTISGPGGTSQVVPVGSYDLSETGPTTYSAGSWSCDKGQNGASVTVGLGDNITCTIINTAIPSQWNVVKTATVVGKSYDDPAHAEPGDTIHFVITATRVGSGVDIYNVDVTDHLADVTDDADLQLGTVTATNGTATVLPAPPAVDATSIDWHINQISTSVELSYDVVVHADAFNTTLRNFITAPGSGNCPVGSTDPDCSTTHKTPSWTLVKTSPESTTVMPGDTIHYTLTVTNNSATDVLHAVVDDDLTAVLNHASLDLPLAAGLTETATGLHWVVGGMPIAPGDHRSISYSVTVDQHAWNVDIDNLATPGEPGGTCEVLANCTTHHETPPVTTFVVKKVDFETGAPLAGAHFILWIDNGTIGQLDPADVQVGDEEITGANGLASWDELLAGPYLIQETQAPPGYALPAVTVHAVTIETGEGARDWTLEPFIVEDPSVGHLAVVAKQQYEKNANGNWVLSDGVTDYGTQVKYIVRLEATGTKLFHNVKTTDWVPGFNPNDSHVFGDGSTMKASLVPGSAKCLGITCNISVSPGHLVTWAVPGSVKNEKWSVEMIVNFPKAPVPTPFDADGFFNSSLWNVAFLDYDEAVANTPGSRVVDKTLPMKHTKLRSNEVVITATLVEPPPGIVPCTAHCLPNTGSSPYLLQLGALGGLALFAGMALVVRGRRRGEATE